MWENILAINIVLKKKTTKLDFQPAQYEKNKFDKYKFEKKSIKRHVGKHYSNLQFFFQEKNYKAKLSTSSI
jgi:hypothetical protein